MSGLLQVKTRRLLANDKLLIRGDRSISIARGQVSANGLRDNEETKYPDLKCALCRPANQMIRTKLGLNVGLVYLLLLSNFIWARILPSKRGY